MTLLKLLKPRRRSDARHGAAFIAAEHGIAVETGEFGADMAVSLINDGPVTIWMDSQDWAKGA